MTHVFTNIHLLATTPGTHMRARTVYPVAFAGRFGRRSVMSTRSSGGVLQQGLQAEEEAVRRAISSHETETDERVRCLKRLIAKDKTRIGCLRGDRLVQRTPRRVHVLLKVSGKLVRNAHKLYALASCNACHYSGNTGQDVHVLVAVEIYRCRTCKVLEGFKLRLHLYAYLFHADLALFQCLS
jgi:hypothetical protein